MLAALCSGGIFGAGLALSGMTNPAKVLNFLDVTGTWDPSLALVMASALMISALGFRIGGRRATPLFSAQYSLPTRRDLDLPLIAGAALFGVGWGLAGICPGPAMAMLALDFESVLPFVLALCLGIGLQDWRAT